MLKMHSEEFEKDLKAFEDRLYLHFKKYFDLNVSFFRRLSEVIEEKKNEVEPKSDFQRAINFLFGRSYRLYWTILVLCEKGFGPEAGILLRSLMEHAVNMDWIAKENPDQRARLFLDYVHVARKQLYENYDKHGIFPKLTHAEMEWMESREEIERLYREVKHNYLDERRWAPESIRSRADEIGTGYDWDFYYWHLSFFSHSNAASQFELVRPGEPENLFAIGPSNSMIKDVLHLSYKYLLGAFNRWNVVFELGLDKLVLDLFEKLEDISIIRQERERHSRK